MLPLWLRKILYWITAMVAMVALKMLIDQGVGDLGDFSMTTLFIYLAAAPTILILDSLLTITTGSAKSFSFRRSYMSGSTHVSEYEVIKEQGREAIKLSLLRLIYPAVVFALLGICFITLKLPSH